MYSKAVIDQSGHFGLEFGQRGEFSILQLTDLHTGFGPLSKKADAQVLTAVETLVRRSEPDLIIITGDMIYPFLPKSGTLNNRKQMRKLCSFLDSFRIPYTFCFGNHDVEMGSFAGREELAGTIKSAGYAIFDQGPEEIFGVGNFIINLRDGDGALVSSLVLLDSNMYGGGWFYSGFDCIHDDQVDWAMNALEGLKACNDGLTAHAFFHMPLAEYKEAYEKMKLGNPEVRYNFGSVAEENDYFGISKNECSFFERAAEAGIIRGIFCGHDHLNTISMGWRGINLTYGMSLDFHAYGGIKKRYTQRGGTLLTIERSGEFRIEPLPLGPVVSEFVRGLK